MNFLRGQIFEGVVGGIRRSAKVIAIVDGGRIGWLEYIDTGTKMPPFELDSARLASWAFVPQP